MTNPDPPAVIYRLADFIHRHRDDRLPTEVLHQAKRLLLNGLRASVVSYQQPTIKALAHRVQPDVNAVGDAQVLWLGSRVRSEEAALINAAQWFYSLIDDCHLPTGTHPTAPAAAAALAEAEVVGVGGAQVLRAIVLAVEVELALSVAMMPGLRVNRGFAPVVTGCVAAATAAAIIRGLDRDQTAHALGMAMLTQVGLWEMSGTPAGYYAFGENARAGVVAAQLAELGLTCPDSIFEGGHGALRAYSGESMDKVEGELARLGHPWRIMEASCQQFSGDTVTQAPLECIFEIRKRVKSSQIDGATLTFSVDPLTAQVAQYRRKKFGRPRNPIEATSDPLYCMAAAWFAGRFTSSEKGEPYLSDPRILDLRDHISLRPTGEPDARQYQRASLEVSLADGTSESAHVEAFVGHWQNPLTDSQLENIFREAADGLVAPSRLKTIVDSVWNIDASQDIGAFARLLVADAMAPTSKESHSKSTGSQA